MEPGRGGQPAKTGSAEGQIPGCEEKFSLVRLSSGEVRLILATCSATIGQVGNIEHELIVVGKAGRSRWLGKRPSVRGLAMNPVDHPHGGGEGRAPIGLKSPVSPWGKPTLGYKTRKKSKPSSQYIVRERRRKK